jgi:hypothetical protein
VGTCPGCNRGVEAEFRFCPRCGAALRSKIVEYFPGNDDLGDGALRVSVYLEPPQHVRLSIWKEGPAAQAALSLDPWEADRLVDFLQSLRITKRRRIETAFHHSLRALGDTLAPGRKH